MGKNFLIKVLALISLFSLQSLFMPFSSKADEPLIRVIAVGDLMMGRHIDKVMKRRGDIFPFMNFITPFKRGDIIFANLESVLGDKEDEIYFPEKKYNFIAPLGRAAILQRLGFNVLSLANNHAMDYGPGPIAKTRRIMKEAGIFTFGAGMNLDEARRPAVITRKGVRFGFVGYSNGHSRKVYATEKRAGVVPEEKKYILEDIAALKGKADVIIVSLHWGIEYDKYPSKKQRKLAHELIDAGADMILGHHPHVMQGVELYKGKPVAYSLGNFLFDQRHDDTMRSFMLNCLFKGSSLYRLEIVPLDRYNSYFPKVARGEKRDEMLDYIRELSRPLSDSQKIFTGIGF